MRLKLIKTLRSIVYLFIFRIVMESTTYDIRLTFRIVNKVLFGCTIVRVYAEDKHPVIRSVRSELFINRPSVGQISKYLLKKR